MIKIESVKIVETRGIRALELSPNQKNFAISGPNGSGKSGVIDAVEFALTGAMKRLTGPGTKGLTVSEHGPHVDKAKFPGASYVEVGIFIPKLGKSASIKRSIEKPGKPEIIPDEEDVRQVLENVFDHPEITLSRRDIVRFILVEPSERSKEIQALLKLDRLGDTRAALNTAQNRLRRTYEQAQSTVKEAKRALQLHLQIEELRPETLLAAVNDKRAVLGLDEIMKLEADTKLDQGLNADDAASRFNKESALRDIAVLEELAKGVDTLGVDTVYEILTDIQKLEEDPGLFLMIQQRALIEKGLGLVDGPACPLCDLEWENEAHLRAHLEAKLDKSKVAQELTQRLQTAASRLCATIVELTGKLDTASQVASAKDVNALEQAKVFLAWRNDLKDFAKDLSRIDRIIGQKKRFESGWLNTPKVFQETVKALEKTVRDKPDQSSIIAAQTYLSTAQVRLQDYNTARKKLKAAEAAAKTGKAAYETYCKVLENELNALYDDVQNDFSNYYRALNEDDEDSFNAKFTPSEGALGLDVNFYERGLFPPGAYHSEGHQDGMGVCLYLALMKRLFGEEFSLALLDDVVMSVDADHRYQFCKLLKSEFPNTQFILTTHDRVWAEQMKSAGLVTSKTSLAFHSWSVDTGPLVESNDEIWNEIDDALNKGKAEIAALSLRRHLEYFASHQCDSLGGTPQYKADGKYDLGDLLPAALSRMKKLAKRAISAAQSWGDEEAKKKALSLSDALSKSNAASQTEQWAVNPAVHYNEWANLGKKDLTPVVSAFRELLEIFQCKTCNSWIYAAPKSHPEALRCSCNALNLNLNEKPK